MRTAGAKHEEPAEEAGRIGPFVRSKMFSNLFASGMALVEETASYLDNDGRKASRDLSREAALSYAGVSMRLTTRLMQIASWLLVLRAVREGEMTQGEARHEKYRIGPAERRPQSAAAIAEASQGLPEALQALIQKTDTLYARITRLDHDLFGADEDEVPAAQGAAGQLQALRDAFGGR
jgi:regulator of CtrA degradation